MAERETLSPADLERLVCEAQDALGQIGSLKDEVNSLRAEVQRLQGLAHRFEGSIRVLQMLGASLDLAEVLGHFDREARRLAAFDRLAIMLTLEEDPDHVRLLTVLDDGGIRDELLERRTAKGMQVIGEWRPIKRKLWPGEFTAPDDSRLFAAGVRCILEVPLSLPDAPLGVAQFGSFEEDAFEMAESVILGAMAASLGQALANCRTVEAMVGDLTSLRARQGQPGVAEGVTPHAVREFLGDHLQESDDWFNGLAQGLLQSAALDTYQVERLEEWWVQRRE
jgi:hypothetical protein